MSAKSELLVSRDSLFTPVELGKSLIFCGDEREPEGIDDSYIHWFGGTLNPIYNSAVLRELSAPTETTENFTVLTARLVPVLIEAVGRAGVHSDTANEHANQIDVNRRTGGVGCGYAGLRREISLGIANNADSIVSEARLQRPELFTTSQDAVIAIDITKAHGRLAENGFITPGRQVILAAIDKGAESMLVKGSHAGKDGIINLDAGSTLRTGRALKAGLPAYDHDEGSLDMAWQKIKQQVPHDERVRRIASLIDTIGTMWALSVETIATRRPAKRTA